MLNLPQSGLIKINNQFKNQNLQLFIFKGAGQERGLPRVRVRHEVLHEELAAVSRQAHPPPPEPATAGQQEEARKGEELIIRNVVIFLAIG